MRSKYDDREDEDSDGPGFITGFLWGAAIGAVAALLYAPMSGEETRKELTDLANQQKDSLKNQWDTAKDKIADVVNVAKDKVNSLAEDAKGAVDTYAEKAKAKVDQYAGDAKSTVDKVNGGTDDLA